MLTSLDFLKSAGLDRNSSPCTTYFHEGAARYHLQPRRTSFSHLLTRSPAQTTKRQLNTMALSRHLLQPRSETHLVRMFLWPLSKPFNSVCYTHGYTFLLILCYPRCTCKGLTSYRLPISFQPCILRIRLELIFGGCMPEDPDQVMS